MKLPKNPPYMDHAIACASSDGLNVGAVTPTNPMPVNVVGGLSGSDRELVVTTYTVKTAFTGASVGDTITCTQIIDVSGASPSTVSVVWRNQTTAADLASAPSAAKLTVNGQQGLTDGQLRATPIPIVPSHLDPASSAAVTGTANANGNSASFIPDLGRAIWVGLSGVWTGSAQLKRSTDGGNSWRAITTGDGTVKGMWTGNLNAPITEETCSGAIYRLEFTIASGTVTYEVRQ